MLLQYGEIGCGIIGAASANAKPSGGSRKDKIFRPTTVYVAVFASPNAAPILLWLANKTSEKTAFFGSVKMSNKDIILEEKEGQTEFDVILFGTGIVESILACGLSRAGKKILHVDANRFYGGNFASLNLKQYKSYIEGKLDELPSFRSNGTADDQGPITMEEVQRIVGEGEEVDFEPVTFLNSLTSPQNVFGNFHQTDHITEYKSSFNTFERETLRKRYRIKYRIGYTFSMKDKNGLMVYRITKILSVHDVYECQRVFVTKNHNDFPMVIYLDLDQISHTKTYIVS